ncbi:MAG: type I-C CRISPR-associated protein Cas5 [Chloroflexi bacterium]|nr:type I-C CRISPR-associated protein Cas5 [Chloroflexota bacterium]
MENRVEFKVSGRFALFTDPLTKVGGEKCSYHIPTYEALKGIAKSIYWKPTFVWVIDKVRVMKRVRTQSKSVKPVNYLGVYPSLKDPNKKKEEPFHTLSIYTYLADVEYQVQAHFEWNPFREDMAQDRNEGKHLAVAKRMIEKGGRQDIFLGTRECQGYVEPCACGEGHGFYDDGGELAYGLIFHGFDYPDETGKNELVSRFWRPVMKDGIITFPRPEECTIRKFVRQMVANPPGSSGLKGEGLLV